MKKETRKTKKTKLIGTLIPIQEYEELKGHVAEQEEMTVSAFIRIAVKNLIAVQRLSKR